MTQLTPFDAYRIYIGIKLHFGSSSYDYFKYNGKVSVKPESFQKRKDVIFYTGLSKKFKFEDYEDLVVSNIKDNPKLWVRDLLAQNALDSLKRYQSYVQSFSYRMQSDLDAILTHAASRARSMHDLFKIQKEEQYPELLSMVRNGKIQQETLIILDKLLGNLFSNWSESMKNDIIWENEKEYYKKYSPFLLKKIDMVKAKKIFIEKIKKND